MKTITTLSPAVLLLGAFVAVLSGMTLLQHEYGLWRWCLLVAGILIVAWLVATLFNVAIFAPIYWLFSRMASRKAQKEKPRGRDA